MNSLNLVVIIAAIGGAAIATQAQLIGLMDRSIGTMESVFLTYGVGGMLAGLIMLAMRGGNLADWHLPPWYVHSAGLLGLVIVGSISYATPRLGLALTMTIAVAAQFGIAAVIQHYGLLGSEPQPLGISRLGGMAVVLVGVWLMIRP